MNVDKEFGNKYGWSTKKDFDEIVKGFRDRAEKNKLNAGKEPAKKAPAKKAPAKRTRTKK